MPGAITHAANTYDTPSQPQLTFLNRTDATPAPTTPPMIECVVLTGKPYRVAMDRKVEDPMTAHIMTSIRTGGSLMNRCGSTSLCRMVSATLAPTLTEPANSIQAAMAIACFIVKDRDDTDDANELATSLAPMSGSAGPSIERSREHSRCWGCAEMKGW